MIKKLETKMIVNGEGSALKFYYAQDVDTILAEKDKVIALLTDKANYNEYAYKHKSEEFADTCRFYEDELRHHKYKRCLAMAKWCRMHDEFIQLESERLGLPRSTLFLEYRRKSMWWNKWRNRWLELAEKFKEAK